MRISGTTVQKFLLASALLAALAWNLAHAGEIKGLRVSSGATGTRAEIALDQAAEYNVIRLGNPERLVVDLPASRLSRSVVLPDGAGVVRSVRSGQPAPGTVRIVFDLAQPVAALKPRLEQAGDGTRLVLEWPGDGEAMVAADTAKPAASPVPSTPEPPAATQPDEAEIVAASNAATTRLISDLVARAEARSPTSPATAGTAVSNASASKMLAGATAAPTSAGTAVPPPAPDASVAKAGASGAPSAGMPSTVPPKTAKVLLGKGMRPLVIAIDAGHGGQDPGAIGPSGKREKDVVLAIARELARQINATPGMRAHLIRDADVYVERPQRARRARGAKADMFVSIHADAATNRTASGSSVFTLSTRGASSQYARWAADRENASDLVGGVRLERGTLSSVLLDLAQTGHMKASQDAAKLVLHGLRQVGRNHKAQVEYANFEVLRNADMPAMLVETGFISNPTEERRLADPDYQRQVARAVLDGINTYFQLQPPPGTLYAARAAAELSTTASVATGAGGGSP